MEQKKPLVTHIFTADPSAHVFEGKLYVYPSHDMDKDLVSKDDGSQYMMEDYHVLRIDDLDAPAVDCGEAIHMKDIPWVGQQLWAPDAAYVNGKYYLIFPAKDKDLIFRIGVAESDRPEGPFTAHESWIPGSYSVDPAVFVEDGKVYLLLGGLWGGQLEQWQTGEHIPGAAGPSGDEKALGPKIAELSTDFKSMKEELKEIVILGKDGQPLTAGDEEKRFFEGGWIHKYNGKYYLSYSTGSTHLLVYATSDNIYGPYTFGGTFLTPVIGWTTHHSIVEFKGKWYLFYHDASLLGADNKRCVKVTELTYAEDGSIVPINPY
jgi:beta-xylosidase